MNLKNMHLTPQLFIVMSIFMLIIHVYLDLNMHFIKYIILKGGSFRIIGPAMPSAELLAAAAKLTDAQADLRYLLSADSLSDVGSIYVVTLMVYYLDLYFMMVEVLFFL